MQPGWTWKHWDFQENNPSIQRNLWNRPPIINENTGRSQHATGWTWKRWDFQENNLSIQRNLWNIPPIIKEETGRSQHATGWTWKRWDFDRLCPKISPDTAREFAELCGFNYLPDNEGVNVVASEHDGTKQEWIIMLGVRVRFRLHSDKFRGVVIVITQLSQTIQDRPGNPPSRNSMQLRFVRH